MVYGLAPLDIPTPSLRLQPRHRPVEQKDHDPGRRPKIGIAWRSKNPLIGRLKTMALGEWKAVLSAVDADFVSLQYEDGASPLDARPSSAPAVHSLPVDPFGNLDPLAAEIADLDLVISVASTAVHLAGRLGVPMWVLLPRGMGASWFWFNGGDQSPWYPQARLFRQRARRLARSLERGGGRAQKPAMGPGGSPNLTGPLSALGRGRQDDAEMARPQAVIMSRRAPARSVTGDPRCGTALAPSEGLTPVPNAPAAPQPRRQRHTAWVRVYARKPKPTSVPLANA